MSIEESSGNPSTQPLNKDNSEGAVSTDLRDFPAGEHPIDKLLELLEGKFKVLAISSDNSFVIDAVTAETAHIEPLSTAEMKAWLETNEIHQQINGSYWREFRNVAIFGGTVIPGPPPGSSVPASEFFRINISKQKPPAFRLARR